MYAETACQPEHLSERIKGIWNKLTDDDLDLYHRKPDHFFGLLHALYGVHRGEAEYHIEEVKLSLLGVTAH